MEKALHISRLSDFKFWRAEHSRIYFGNEFCDRLIPSEEELDRVLSFAAGRNLGFTLLTTFCTDKNLHSYKKLFDLLSQSRADAEIVINDWGLLKIAKNYPFDLVLGRLLNKQKRGPRIIGVIERLPELMRERFRKSGINGYFSAFLLDCGIKRVELDNLLQGVSLDEFRGKGICCSLYIPFGYITVSRSCPHRCRRDLSSDTVADSICRRECLENRYWLRHPQMPVPLISKGNAVFFENKIIPEFILYKGGVVNRIVYEAEA
ncbi:MAG: hypothetical protein PHO40_00420 [Candidatus Omnitrophica bacterium]|jgi:hypothetical protein|nr:hypothetical protein [Candidatus Omnitrophota bacterium]